MDTNGNVYVADNYNYTIRKVMPGGTNWVVTTIAGSAGSSGSADGTNNAAQFYSPSGLVMDSTGNLFVTDEATIRKMTPVGTNWVVTTIAGSGTSRGSADGKTTRAQV